MQSAVLLKIKSLESSFTSSEHDISKFVIENPEYVISNTITNLAKKTNTSEASINRFSKKIGFKGFNKFKIALAHSMTHLEDQEKSFDESNLIEYVTLDYQKMLTNTCAMLDAKDIEDAASMITLNRKVFILSIYNTSFVSKEFAFKLRQLGMEVTTLKENLETQLAIENMSSDSVLIAVVPSVITKDIIPFLTKIKRKDVKTILISSNDNPKVSDMIDIKFIIPDHMSANNSLVLTNSTMISLVFDIIFATILRDNRSLRQRKLSSDTIINSYESADSAIYEW
ncbi:MurR/RpiR family transcriptional regulator [Enterococcus xiangfangensis]|uniref:MurR/RpiR family transcriptional regulator n=1 Tax=Enterococcus xiangfangensis TaxID=1296537 RepID=UPI0010F66091|nr:MurR/RpiR family transcriptional regulator [Enterococcus xiangfangensis]MBM7712348.1 DNA-binding MurR/RpiR family transcriptional regulator [Enterococcus xiangfangensis]NBK08975.1 MurR/RpiR family transcriptional regulator [Enterococcus asini]